MGTLRIIEKQRPPVKMRSVDDAKRCKYIREVIEMTSYREILRLHSQGLSQRSIAASCEYGDINLHFCDN